MGSPSLPSPPDPPAAQLTAALLPCCPGPAAAHVQEQKPGAGSATDMLKDLAAYLTLEKAQRLYNFSAAQHGISEAQAAEIATVFSAFDSDDNGYLSLDEFQRLWCVPGGRASCVASGWMDGWQAHPAQRACVSNQGYDIVGLGASSRQRLGTLVTPACCRPAPPLRSARYAPDLSTEEVKAGMEMLDANNDKLISLSEFVDWWVKKAA